MTMTPAERASLLATYREGHAQVVAALAGIGDAALDAHPIDWE